MLRLVTLTVALSACTYQAREHVLHVGLALTTTAIACDVGETIWLGHGGQWDRTYMKGPEIHMLKETNPLIGQEPSTNALLLIGVTALAVNTGFHLGRLPQWTRLAWSVAILGAETYAVTHNARWSPACGVGR